MQHSPLCEVRTESRYQGMHIFSCLLLISFLAQLCRQLHSAKNSWSNRSLNAHDVYGDLTRIVIRKRNSVKALPIWLRSVSEFRQASADIISSVRPHPVPPDDEGEGPTWGWLTWSLLGGVGFEVPLTWTSST